MEKSLSIKFDAALASYEEVTDSIADAIEGGIILEKALGDGFQITDILAVVELQPKVQEIINDYPIFLQQFLQLKPDTAAKALSDAVARIRNSGKVLGKVTTFLVGFLENLTKTYAFGNETYEKALERFNDWKMLITPNQNSALA